MAYLKPLLTTAEETIMPLKGDGTRIIVFERNNVFVLEVDFSEDDASVLHPGDMALIHHAAKYGIR